MNDIKLISYEIHQNTMHNNTRAIYNT
jgi:hypothetical protein